MLEQGKPVKVKVGKRQQEQQQPLVCELQSLSVSVCGPETEPGGDLQYVPVSVCGPETEPGGELQSVSVIVGGPETEPVQSMGVVACTLNDVRPSSLVVLDPLLTTSLLCDSQLQQPSDVRL